ncbi:MAG: hypothetical protein QM718_04825 [Steroidobacteraceae bacterium]
MTNNPTMNDWRRRQQAKRAKRWDATMHEFMELAFREVGEAGGLNLEQAQTLVRQALSGERALRIQFETGTQRLRVLRRSVDGAAWEGLLDVTVKSVRPASM